MAYDFDGSSSRYKQTSAVLSATPLTMAAWIKPDTNQGIAHQVNFKHAVSNGVQYSIYLASLRPGVQHYDASFNATAEQGSTISTGVWTHICAVFPSTTSRSCFVNGGSKVTSTMSVPNSMGAINTFCIAGLDGGDGALFDGKVAEVAVWTTALSDDEAAALGRGYCPLLIQPQSLFLYYPLVRDLIELKRAASLTAVGSPTVADHPRIVYPSSPL